RAISLVRAGGVVWALLGPERAKWSRDLFAPVTFAGCFAMIVALQTAAAALLYFVRLPPAPPRGSLRGAGRPLGQIVRQRLFVVALAAGMIGYAVMSLVMTATPIAMIGCGYGFVDAAF